MVVLPEPVGPLSMTRPCGAEILSSSRRSRLSRRPSCSGAGRSAFSSSRRITIFSPSTVGEEETRMSSGMRRICAVMRPSCGRRRSATSMPASTLMREVSAGCSASGMRHSSCRMPSMRSRTIVPSSAGSMWMSDAPCS